MYQIGCYGYNGDYFCISVLEKLNDCIKYIGNELWKYAEEDNGSYKISFRKIEKDLESKNIDFDNFLDNLDFPLFGQCYSDLLVYVRPFNFGELVSFWSDD